MFAMSESSSKSVHFPSSPLANLSRELSAPENEVSSATPVASSSSDPTASQTTNAGFENAKEVNSHIRWLTAHNLCGLDGIYVKVAEGQKILGAIVAVAMHRRC